METDINAVCRWIHSTRKSSRENKYAKKITIPLFEEKHRKVSARLTIQYCKGTGNIVLSHSLWYFGKDFYPEINPNKLRCVNSLAIKQHRKYLDNINETISEKTIINRICNHISATTHIAYNINTEHIGIREYLKYRSVYVKTGLKNKKR